MGRSAQGVKGIELEEDDEVRAMDIIQEEKEKKLLVVSEKGIGKKTKLNNFSAQSRGGKGIKAAQTSKKTGPIAGAKIIHSDDEELIVASSKGKILRTELAEIPTQKRNTQGVKIMRLKEGDKVASFTIV
jgi:DNA gyrase subunit A